MSKLTDVLKTNVETDTMALVCKCGGGGVDYDTENNDVCATCKGTGLYNWNYDYFLEHTEQQIKELFLELDPDFAEDLKEIWIGRGSLDWKKKAASDRVKEHNEMITSL